MKSTPTRGVKEHLKPNAYKQVEPRLQITRRADVFYVYVIKSERDEHYIGYSADLKARIKAHNDGQNASTRGRKWALLYYEAYASEPAARERERVLKHDGRTRRALMERLNRGRE